MILLQHNVVQYTWFKVHLAIRERHRACWHSVRQSNSLHSNTCTNYTCTNYTRNIFARVSHSKLLNRHLLFSDWRRKRSRRRKSIGGAAVQMDPGPFAAIFVEKLPRHPLLHPLSAGIVFSMAHSSVGRKESTAGAFEVSCSLAPVAPFPPSSLYLLFL